MHQSSHGNIAAQDQPAQRQQGGVMKRKALWGLTALVLALAVNTFAQEKSTADVPFAFAVDQTWMSAGHYTITQVSDRVLQVRNDDTKATVSIIAQHEELVNARQPQMIFHKYGNRYVLAEVWNAKGGQGLELPASKMEKEMSASNPGGVTEVVVAMR
jgi:hypothetical protein